MGAASSFKHKLLRRDFDRVCDLAPKRRRLVPYISGAMVGMFRLMRQDIAFGHRGFSSAREFDLSTKHVAL